MSFAAWVLVGLLAAIAVLLIWLGLTLKRIESLKDQLKAKQEALDDLRHRMADLVATIDLLVGPDPTPAELHEAVATAVAGTGGGLSEVEQRAADRILGSPTTGGS